PLLRPRDGRLDTPRRSMSKHYDLCSDDVRRIVDLLLKERRPELATAGLHVDLLWASSDDDESPLKLGGYSCAAVVRITSAKERAAGRGDAEITIDKTRWEKRSARQREALLFHELHHLALKTKAGIPQVDAHNRPCLKMRLHDHQFGWFDEVARIY